MPRITIFFFGLLPVYWAYLVFHTQPVIIYDAVGYESLGRLILHQGWGAYFQGLSREPLFPYLISCAMRVGEWLSLPYYYFLKTFLLVSLAITLVGIYRLARLLGAGHCVAGLGALYAGLSPALLNSTLWLWSEAAALPWGVWGVFFCIKSWRSAMACRGLRRTAFLALVAAALFTGLLLVKAAVSAVVPLYMVPFFGAGILFLFRRDWCRARAFMMIALIVLGLFISVTEVYKAVNFRMNGNYALTNRFDWALFGNTVRRLQPLTKERIAQAVLSVPRLAFCEKFYGRECVFWSFPTSDAISRQGQEYCTAQGFDLDQRREFLMGRAFGLMAQHPFQQAALSVLEGMKMFFWENRVYFVRYPKWMVDIYGNNGFVYALCFGWALLSLSALLYALTRRSAEFLLASSFVFWFIAVHTIFFIDIRYALPVAPIFIALVAGMFGRRSADCLSD